MTKQNNEKYYILRLPLKTSVQQERVLEKKFNIAQSIKSIVIDKMTKRCNEMMKTKKYRENIAKLREIYNSPDRASRKLEEKAIKKELDNLRKEYKIGKNEIMDLARLTMGKSFPEIGSKVAEQLALDIWPAYDEFLFGGNNEIHHKDKIATLGCKDNRSGIKFRFQREEKIIDGKKTKVISYNQNGYPTQAFVEWGSNLKIPVILNYDNLYEMESISKIRDERYDVVQCKIGRKFVKNKYKYELFITLKGIPPRKIDKETGEVKNLLGEGPVGIDIGMTTVAVCSKSGVHIFELADKIQPMEEEKAKIQRKMDRSKRFTNPENYNEDGTCKEGELKWNFSKNYIVLSNKLRDLERRQRETRKIQHEELANKILSYGDVFYVEEMDFDKLQRRSTETVIDESGRIASKKRFGKVIAQRSPAMLLNIIDRKLSYYGKELIKINTYETKASQYDHTTGISTKVNLDERSKRIDGHLVQRDMYSSYLLMNISDDLTSFNQEACEKGFESFLESHDKEIERLKEKENLPKSIGIDDFVE